jgi:sarcosine oxidase
MDAGESADIAIVGAGIMGAAVAWALGRRGARAVLLEQYPLHHDLGSSHGASRIFRLGYEQEDYIVLAQEARRLWRDLERELGVRLIVPTGVLDVGPENTLDVLVRAMTAAGVDIERLQPGDVRPRFPAFRPPTGWGAIFHPDGGTLLADEAWRGFVASASRAGVAVRDRTRVTALSRLGDEVVVHTDGGVWRVRRVVVAAAGWSNLLLDAVDLHVPFVTTREHVAYYAVPDPAPYVPFIWHAGSASPGIYGLGNGTESTVKVGNHGSGPVVDPADTGAVDLTLAEPLNRFVRDHLSGVPASPARVDTCLYAATPDDDFVLDRRGPIVLAMGFGGHGFKFAPLVGEMVADLATDDSTDALPRFRYDRFVGG